MELGDGTPASPRASATILMLRDGARGLEVFLLERNQLSEVHGGVYVFPGGKLDAADAFLCDRLDRPAQLLKEGLGEEALTPEDAAALHVAAIREVYEEAGVLFAQEDGSEPAPGADLQARSAFEDVVRSRRLRLSTRALVPWSRWITPTASPQSLRHFDTRFFVACAPLGQLARHDAYEATASVWIAPREALRAYWEGRIRLAPPQIMTMAHLARHADLASAVAEASSRKPPRIHPEVFEEDGVLKVCYPGHPRHSVRERAMPGPSYLVLRGGRHEPLEGFDALFA